MRVLVTGGAGFIGSHVADALLAAGHSVDVLDDLSSGRRENVPADARLHVVDLRDGAAVGRLFAEVRPDAVSHQAAQASVSVSVREPILDAETNVLGTIHVLEGCRAHGARIAFASTGGALYGEVPDGQRATIDWPAQPYSPYAASKTAGEHYLRMYGALHGVPWTILRYANVYGPRQSPHGEAGVVAIFLSRALRGEALTIFARRTPGDGGCVRDYVYVSDVVAANLAALEGRLDGRTLNVSTGVPTTTADLAARLLNAAVRGPTPSGQVCELRDGPRREGDLERSVLDPATFVAAIGEPVALDDGLARTAAWFAQAAGAGR